METIDWIALIFGSIWGITIFILYKRNKPKMWPSRFGIGTGVYAFVFLMISSILQRPISEFTEYTLTNFILSLPFIGIGYLGGRELARRFPN